MIYGIVPVGGKGLRLNIPFDKEMMPIIGHDKYYPICQFTVDKLVDAGCEIIYFIHGNEYKNSILERFDDSKFIHIKNTDKRQSEIFLRFYDNVDIKENDIFLYGLPDSIYDDTNPFSSIKHKNGLVCGMFEVSDELNVGRIDKNSNTFIKSIWSEYLTKHCWGIIKLDKNSLEKLVESLKNNPSFEMEEILNTIDCKTEYFGKYWDLGTWKSLDEYYSSKYSK